MCIRDSLATLHSRRGPWSWFRGTGTVVETLALGMVTGWLAITRGDVVWITLATAGGFLVMMLAHAADKNIRTWLRAIQGESETSRRSRRVRAAGLTSYT